MTKQTTYAIAARFHLLRAAFVVVIDRERTSASISESANFANTPLTFKKFFVFQRSYIESRKTGTLHAAMVDLVAGSVVHAEGRRWQIAHACCAPPLSCLCISSFFRGCLPGCRSSPPRGRSHAFPIPQLPRMVLAEFLGVMLSRTVRKSASYSPFAIRERRQILSCGELLPMPATVAVCADLPAAAFKFASVDHA
nr:MULTISPECIES: hypothetical protein [unclassified Streptomyces]